MFNICLAYVNNQIGECKAVFDYMLGSEFFMLKIDGHNTILKILMLTPFMSI